MQINVLDYLEKTAAKYPGKIAIIDEQNRIKFSRTENAGPRRQAALLLLKNRCNPESCSGAGKPYSGSHYFLSGRPLQRKLLCPH